MLGGKEAEPTVMPNGESFVEEGTRSESVDGCEILDGFA